MPFFVFNLVVCATLYKMHYSLVCKALQCDSCLIECHITCTFVKAIMHFVKHAKAPLYSKITLGVVHGQYVDCIFNVPATDHGLRQDIIIFGHNHPDMRWCYSDQHKIILRSMHFDKKDYDKTFHWSIYK